MKKVRIIPRLDIKGPNVVKGVHLEGVRVIGDPEELATKYYMGGADELIYMDVVASLYGRNHLADVVEKTSSHIFIPLSVGGGIRSLDGINTLLRAGADKVSINSWIIKNPDFVNQAARTFGTQCIVGSIEAKRKPSGGWEALYNNGREVSGRNALEWALELVDRGIGELIVTSVDQEGTARGFDLELVNTISTKVPVPVIACGGAGSMSDIKSVIFDGKADAVSAAHVFHYNKLSVDQIKTFMSSQESILA